MGNFFNNIHRIKINNKMEMDLELSLSRTSLTPKKLKMIRKFRKQNKR
jgi:hypothetical protein